MQHRSQRFLLGLILIALLAGLLPPEQRADATAPPPVTPRPAATSVASPRALYLPIVARGGEPAATITPDAGGTLDYQSLRLEFPPGAVSRPTRVTYTPRADAVPGLAGRRVQVFDLHATANDGNAVTRFAKPVTLRFRSNPAAVRADGLKLLHLNETSQQWEPVGASVDTTSGVLTANLEHFSTYAAAGPNVNIEITWVGWEPLAEGKTRFTIRTISGAQPSVSLQIDSEPAVQSSSGTDYDLNTFTLEVGPHEPGSSHSFTVSAGGVSFQDTFTVGSSGSHDIGVEIGEGGNAAAFLAGWRTKGTPSLTGPAEYGKPKDVVGSWNGMQSQELWGSSLPDGAFKARLVENSRCGRVLVVKNGILSIYESDGVAARLGAPLGFETNADEKYGYDWKGSYITEFEHGFIAKRNGSDAYTAQAYPPSVGNVIVSVSDAGDNKLKLTFSAQVRLKPGEPSASDPVEVVALWKGPDGGVHTQEMSAAGGETYTTTFDSPSGLLDPGTVIFFSVGVTRKSDGIINSYPLDRAPHELTVNAGSFGPFGDLMPHPQDVSCDSFATPPDNQPPTVEIVEIWPDGQGNLSVMAVATDDRGVASVSISGSPGTASGNMQLKLGTSYGTGVYAGGFTQVPASEIVNFTVEARDASGLSATASADSSVPFQSGFGECLGMCQEGNPVNTALGNDTDTYTDLVVPGRGDSDIVIARTVNSQDERGGPFGRGSSFLYDVQLTAVRNWLLDGVQIRFGDGSTANFSDTGAGRYTSVTPGNFDFVERDGAGYVLRRKDRVSYRFDGDGRLLEIRNRNDVPLVLTYSSGKLSRISNASSRSVELEWQGDQIVAVRVAQGKQISYRYEGNLLRFVTDANGHTSEFQYDSAGRVIAHITPKGTPHTRQAFDTRGRVIWQIVGQTERRDFQYDDAARTTTVTDANGYRTVYTYDQNYRLAAVTDARGHTTRSVYDARGNLVSFTDRRGATWTYGYDANGNRIRQTDPIDGYSAALYGSDITTWSYNAFSDLAVFTDALGHTTRYTYDARGNLTRLDLPDGAQVTTTYDSYGDPLSVTDARGNTAVNSYDPVTGDLLSVTDAEGNTTRFGYDDLGRQTSITDGNGHTVRMVYDGNDQITEVIDAKGGSTRFGFDPNGNLTDTYDRLGAHTRHEYDAADRLVTTTDSAGARTLFGYEPMGHTAVVTNARGFSTQTFYDPVYNVNAIRDEAGYWQHFSYDQNRNRTAAVDAYGKRTRFVYDVVNRLKFQTDPLGHTVEYCYNALDQVIQIFDPRRAETRFRYDAQGRLDRVINPLGEVREWTYDGNGNTLTDTNGERETTRYGYDQANRQVRVTNPLGKSIVFERDGVGNLTSVTDPLGNTTRYGFDANNNLGVVTNTVGLTVTLSYDAEDQQIAVRDAAGGVSRFVYNPDGTLKESIQPGGASTHLGYDPNKNLIEVVNARGLTSTVTYDPRDLRVAETDPLGHTTSYRHDALGRQIAQTDAAGKTYLYSYDDASRLIQVTDPITGVTSYGYDPVGNTTVITYANGITNTFQYNFLNQLVREVDALQRTTRYDYDRAGRMVRKVDGAWRATRYEYDDVGRLTATIFGGTGRRVDFRYDDNGNQTEMRDWNGVLTRSYDALSRPITVTDALSHTLIYAWNPDGTRASLTYPDGRVVTATYDLDKQVERLGLPGGQYADYSYTPVGNLDTISYSNGTRASATYDKADRLIGLRTSGSGDQPIAWYDYVLDKVGNRTSLQERRIVVPGLPAATVARSYSYDDLHRLTGAAASGAETGATNWQYDAVGNWTSRSTTLGASAPVSGTTTLDDSATVSGTSTLTTTYAHNANNALEAAGAWSYEYDQSGNRIKASAPISATQYAPLTPTFGLSATVVITYAYDFEQRLITAQAGISHTLHLSSSAPLTGTPGLTNTIALTDTSGVRATTVISPVMGAVYTYDGMGRRIAKDVTSQISGSTVLTAPVTLRRAYVYDGLDPIVEYESRDGGPEQATYLYYANGRLVAQEQDPISDTAELLWYHHDAQGSVVALSDDSGAVRAAYRYDEYGQLLSGDLSRNRYSYTGREYDAETGFLAFYARHYDPQNGVWLQRDSYRGSLDDPLSLARYAYVTNNPLALVDPLGNWGLPNPFQGVVDTFNKAKDAVGEVVQQGVDWAQKNQDVIAKTALTVGAVAGTAALCVALPGVGCAIGAGLIAASASYGNQVVDNAWQGDGWKLDKSTLVDNIDWRQVVVDGVLATATMGMTKGADKLAKYAVNFCKSGTCAMMVSKGIGAVENSLSQMVSNFFDPCAELLDNVGNAALMGFATSGTASTPKANVASQKINTNVSINQVSSSQKTGAHLVSTSTKRSSHSQQLRKNLGGNPAGTKPGEVAAHHIVAVNSKKAARARQILNSFKIDINSADNGVFLPNTKTSQFNGAYHRTIHTNKYYDYVNYMLSGANTRDEALEILNDLKNELKNNTIRR